LHDQLKNLQTSCTGTFQHRFQSNKSQSRKRKENTRKSVKRKKEGHEARTSDILKKIAPEGKMFEGKMCTKNDINKEILRNLGKREKKWAYSFLSKECTLLDEGAKEEIRLSLADESDEDSSDCAIDIESGDEVIVE